MKSNPEITINTYAYQNYTILLKDYFFCVYTFITINKMYNTLFYTCLI